MAFALWRKQIHCPNYGYGPRPGIEHTGCGVLILSIVTVVVGLIFWPLLLVAGLLLLWMILKPAKQVCAKCGYLHPIPLKHYRATHQDGSGAKNI